MTATAEAIRGGGWAGGVPTAAPSAGTEAPRGIVGWALTYIQPLPQWFDELVGDPATVESVAQGWTQTEAELTEIALTLQRAQRQLEPLEGRMIRTLDLRYEDLNPAALECAEWSGAIAAAARLASSVVAGTRQFILDCLYQLERLIGSLFGFTLNPFDKVDQLNELIDAASELWNAGKQFIDNMLDAFARLIELLESLAPVIEALLVHLRETVALMMPVLGGAVGGLLGTYYGGTIRDGMRDIGPVSRYEGPSIDDPAYDAKRRAWEEAQQVERLDSFADFVGVNGTTDRMGGKDSTAFDIKLVRADDGSEHWVVSLPSTQEWLDAGGEGAMNDGKNNLGLMLNGDLQTQFERAALRAMQEAGMADGDPVVFTGFSQGGILAAKLASSGDLPYDPIGVITNGSPVDGFDVPSDVPVVAFQHSNDIVPKLDGNFGGSDRDNYTTVDFGRHDEARGYDPNDSHGAHSNAQYVTSIEHSHEASGLWEEEYSWMGGEVIDHQVFEAVQR